MVEQPHQVLPIQIQHVENQLQIGRDDSLRALVESYFMFMIRSFGVVLGVTTAEKIKK